MNNYAETYRHITDERFQAKALTGVAVNADFDWEGTKTVRLYDFSTAPMNDYVKEGISRYGNTEELSNTVSELTLANDRSFTFTIDQGNTNYEKMEEHAGQALRRQIDEVVIPELDQYRLQTLTTKAGKVSKKAITKENAYEALLDATMFLSEHMVPQDGRVAFVSPTFYRLIKLDPAFIRLSDLSQEMLITGGVGMVDNVIIIQVPSGYMKTDTAFIMTHPLALTSPVKLAEYKIHDNPPGINGWLLEGRVFYDAFVLPNKKDAIFHQSFSA